MTAEHGWPDGLQKVQQKTRETLAKYLGQAANVALLDFPRHPNAGDSLIWLGERAYLRDLHVGVRFTASRFHLDEQGLLARHPDGPLLLHGGGNFGDRWAEHQAHRERIIQTYRDRRIVQLPQSIEFANRENLARAQRIFGEHPDLILLMRDYRSAEEAEAAFPHNTVDYCPDAALGVGMLRTMPASASHDAVLLLRTDSEGAGHGFRLSTTHHVLADWELTGWRRLAWGALLLPGNVGRLSRRLGRAGHPLTAASLEAIARLNVTTAVRVLSRGRVVVTDRLHAMVLAALLRQPVIALDNANGKLSRIFGDYLHLLPGVHFASSTEDAHRLLRDILDTAR